MLREFNEGGSHQQNPLGGIPLGQNNSGQPVTVEQGETAMKTPKGDFVFSDRIMIDKPTITNLGLPKNFTGKTMADASKYINRKFEGRHDNISNSTKQKMLDNLAASQEIVKAEMQAKHAEVMNRNSGDMNPEGQMPPEFAKMFDQQQMFFGGDINTTTDLAGAAGNTNGTGVGAGVFNTAAGLGTALIGSSEKNRTAPSLGATVGSSALSGMAMGATIGSAVPVIGTAIGAAGGAVIGGTVGLIKGKKQEKERARETNRQTYTQNAMYSDNYAMGGYIGSNPQNQMLGNINYTIDQINQDPIKRAQWSLRNNGYDISVDGKWGPKSIDAQSKLAKMSGVDLGKVTTPNHDLLGIPQDLDGNIVPMHRVEKTPVTPSNESLNYKGAGSLDYDGTFDNTGSLPVPDNTITGDVSLPDNSNKGISTDKFGQLLRYSPILANAMQLKSLKQPQMDRPLLNDSVAQRRYVDEAGILRNADNAHNGTVRALGESGMSGGSLRNSILAAGLNRNRALGEAYAQADATNRNVDDRADAIDRDANMRNNAERARVKENYDRDLGAYLTRKSQLQSQIGTDIGNIGREETYKDLAVKATGYTWDGKYFKNKNGDRLTAEQYRLQLEAESKKSTDSKAVGGFIFRGR